VTSHALYQIAKDVVQQNRFEGQKRQTHHRAKPSTSTARRVRRYKRNARDGGKALKKWLATSEIIPNMSGPEVPTRRLRAPRPDSFCRGKGPRIQAQTATERANCSDAETAGWGRFRIERAASSRALPVCDAPDGSSIAEDRKVRRRLRNAGSQCMANTTQNANKIQFRVKRMPRRPRFRCPVSLDD